MGIDSDSVTYEVVRHRLYQITEEMGIVLKHVSVSPVITEVNDFSTGIFLPNGDMTVNGSWMSAHVGSSPLIVKSVIRECEDDLGIDEDDMFFTNDPWCGILHQADVSVVAPVHLEGKLIAWTQCTAHQLDIGAIMPGFSVTREVYQEGIRLPPVRIVDRGVLRNDLFKALINMVRVPQVALDIKGLIAANNVAKRRIHEVSQQHGAGIVCQVMARNIQESARRFRNRLLEFPDGSYTHRDYIESDGFDDKIYTVNMCVTKKDDNITFDLNGTSAQAPGSINCTLAGTLAGICGGLLPWICFDIPWNQGILNGITVIAPESTLCNATIPAPVGRASVAAAWLVKNCTQACLGRMMGRNEKYLSKAMSVWMGNQTPVLLSGQNQFGERFAYILIDSIAGGCGASSSHDGMDCAGDSYVVTLMIANIETHESTNPVLFLYRKRLRDSGGPGKYRGGLSMEECFIPYDTERLHLTALAHGVEVPNASGLFGGYPGCCSKFMLVKQADVTRKLGQGLPQSIEEMQGEKVELPVCVPSMWIDRRDAFCYWWSGGGGFGDPLERDSDMVLTDVVNECISLDAAKDIYGVVIDDETGRVSADATTKVRQQMRMNRIRDRHDAH